MDAFDLDFEEPGDYKKLEDQYKMEPTATTNTGDKFGPDSTKNEEKNLETKIGNETKKNLMCEKMQNFQKGQDRSGR